MANTAEQIQVELERLFEAGDMQKFEAYALEHFSELPREVQGKVLMQFFSETLAGERAAGAIVDIQEEGIETLQKLKDLQK